MRELAITGHTDNVGSESFNQKLSEERARAMKQALINAGLPTAGLTASGLGPTQPELANNTEEGRRNNRRIEICAP
jgi:OOP family OmpA-OmpF porin